MLDAKRYRRRLAAIVIAILAGVPGLAGCVNQDNKAPTESSAAPQSQDLTSEVPNWESIASQVNDSVVAIQVTSGNTGAAGSGFVLDASKGYVATNNHVASAGTDIMIFLNDGTIYPAKVVGTDSTTDLAVLQFSTVPKGLKQVTFADYSQAVVGQPVMALGNPLGLDDTVTTGIISALNRPVVTVEESASSGTSSDPVVTNAIQTDAAINPGNSGGPLFNASGQVVGMNSSIASLSSSKLQQSGSIGLGFSIPSDTVKMITEQLIASGSAQHSFLGVSSQDGTTTADGVAHAGATVAEITSGGPAEKAGLAVNDVIIGIDDDKTVTSADALVGYVRSYPVGAKLKVTYVRDGKQQEVTVTLAAAPASATTQPTPAPSQLPQDLQKLLQQYLDQLQGGGS